MKLDNLLFHWISLFQQKKNLKSPIFATFFETSLNLNKEGSNYGWNKNENENKIDSVKR